MLWGIGNEGQWNYATMPRSTNMVFVCFQQRSQPESQKHTEHTIMAAKFVNVLTLLLLFISKKMLAPI